MIKKYNEFLNENIKNSGHFKDWFGDSKVVDNDGNPLVVYHGTSDDISEFSSDLGGSNTGNNEVGAFYFTDVYEVAEDYGRQSYVRKKEWSNDKRPTDELQTQAQEEGHIKVLDVYLKMENPLILESTDGHVDVVKTDRYVNFIKNQVDEEGDVWEFFYDQGTYDEDEVEEYREEIIEFAKEEMGHNEDDLEDEDIFRQAVDEYSNYTGNFEKQYPEYDGIIWENVYDGISEASMYVQTVYIVFNPIQIKSASKNKGHYNQYSGNIFEYVEYFQQNEEDEYQLTRVVRDDNHDYEYCDGILYELSHSGKDIMVDINTVEATPENLFYQDQIDRYVEYINNGGILETFPVNESPLGGAYNLHSMCEYLAEPDNFDLLYDLLKNNHEELFDDIEDVAWDSEEKGIENATLESIQNLDELDEYYGDEYRNEYNNDEYKEEDGTLYWNEVYYKGFQTILKYWAENSEYTLTDMNHRFEALKELGKSMVYVDPS